MPPTTDRTTTSSASSGRVHHVVPHPDDASKQQPGYCGDGAEFGAEGLGPGCSRRSVAQRVAAQRVRPAVKKPADYLADLISGDAGVQPGWGLAERVDLRGGPPCPGRLVVAPADRQDHVGRTAEDRLNAERTAWSACVASSAVNEEESARERLTAWVVPYPPSRLGLPGRSPPGSRASMSSTQPPPRAVARPNQVRRRSAGSATRVPWPSQPLGMKPVTLTRALRHRSLAGALRPGRGRRCRVHATRNDGRATHAYDRG